MCLSLKFSSANCDEMGKTVSNAAFVRSSEFCRMPHLLSVDGLSTGSVVVGEVTSLEHELGDDTVEDGVLEAGETRSQTGRPI